MAGYFTESNYENAVLQLLNEELGYNYIYGPDVERDYHSPLYEDVLLPSLQRINKNLPMDALTEAIYKLKNFETGTLLQKNMVFMDYLQNGVSVKYYDKGEERSTLVYLVDFKNPANNEFTVANQWTFIENSEKRPDVILFVNNDPEEWREIIGNKAHKDDMARKFKDNNSPLKIAIVVDMWLTGFDVPSLATMYVYKPMAGHNLMQAIARVNRVFKDKEGGLVVDYVGIAAALKQAMNDYTARDKKNYGDTDVSKAAYPKFLEKLSICRDLFHGFSYEKFMTGSDLDRAKLISGGVNFMLGKSVAEYDLPDNEKTQNVFIKEALLLKQALSLCSSLVDEQTRMEAAFFESVRTMTVRLVSGGTGKKFTLPEVNERINELLKHSIKSEGVINLFSDVQTEFSLFDPKFLEEVANMKEKNLAVELLKKLIAEQVSVYRRTNIVKSEKFSEIIQSAMNRYLNGMLTNEEVIQELLKLAKDIAAAAAEGEKLGLTADELAFYDALTKPQAIKDFYEHDELIAITKELTDLLRKNQTIDWQKKESARAGMRRLVKRLLKKHKYPPEGMDDAVQTVMSQCEMWTDNVMTA